VRNVPQATECEIRPYQEEDEGNVLDLLSVTLGSGPAGRRVPEFFRWKHWENPFGRSYVLVAEAEGRIVGLRALMRWTFCSRDRMIPAVRAVDTATHPDYQGKGIFSRLTREAVEALRGDVDLIFNTPNEKSLPGYLKMGWRIVGKIPISVRVRSLPRIVGGLRDLRRAPSSHQLGPVADAERAMDVLSDPGIGSLLEETFATSDARLGTRKGAEYLRWRYGAPHIDYRGVREHSGGSLTGVGLFRVRPRGRLWESTVAEVIVRPRDTGTARRLIRKIVEAASVDHLTCYFPPGSVARRGARQAGFLPAPRRMTFVMNQLSQGRMRPDPYQLASWALTLGDLEVF
jgi:GNAT superfamily N-acetyltransferase